MLLLRRRYRYRKGIALGEHRDGAHVHLQPVLLPCAGVNRLTVYNHFPDITDLLRACSRSWTERHPAPDPTPWAQISDPQEKVRRALTELYSFYARTESMRANVLRNAQTMPELAALLEGSVVPYLGAVRDLLAEGWEVRGKKRRRLLATLALALAGKR